MGVVASSRRVRSTIGLATGLDPDEGISKRVTSVGRRSETETSSGSVAPVTLLLLASRLLTGSALVDDELGVGPTLLLKERRKSVDELLLIVVGVALGVVGLGGELPAVVVGDVGGETSEARRLASGLVDLTVELSGRRKVGGPSKPATVTGIDVHGNVGKVELLDGVDGKLFVSAGSVGALGDVHVGDQVSERIGLCRDVSEEGFSVDCHGDLPMTRMMRVSE